MPSCLFLNFGFFLQFNKDGDKVIEELKLKVAYSSSEQSGRGNSEEESGLSSSASGRRESDVCVSI